MANTEEIARAGLGLELEGGSVVISDLRTIYSLMAGIVSLSSSIPKNIGGTLGIPTGQQARQGFDSHVQAYKGAEQAKTKIQAEEQKKREQQEKAHQARLGREEQQRKKTGPIAQNDVREEVRAIQRRRDLKAQANAEVARLDAKELARQERVAQQERRILDQSLSEQNRIRRQRLTEARLSDPAYQSGALADRNRRVAGGTFADPYESGLARARFRATRNDPATINDPTTIGYRNQLARDLRASREYGRQQNVIAAQQQREAEALAIKQSRDAALLQDKLHRDVVARARRSEEYDSPFSQRQRRFALGNSSAGFGQYAGRDRSIAYSARREGLVAEYEADLRQTFLGPNRPASRTLTEAEKFRAYVNAGGDPNRYGAPPPPPPRGPGGGGGGRSGGAPRGSAGRAAVRDPQGLFNEKGFFTSGEAIGRISRNILLYQAVSGLTYGLGDYITKAVAAAKTTVEFSNALRFATEQSHGNIETNERLADSLASIGLSRQQGRAAVTEAARFAENRPQDTEALTRTVADIAAARGQGVDRTDELIEQLRRRESKFYKRIFGTTVESIYAQYAGSQIAKQTTNELSTPKLFIDNISPKQTASSIKGRAEEIKSFVAGMDDAEKETAVFNYILAQSGRFQGEAAERADTLAGRLDKMAAAWLNAQEGVGLFITEIKPLGQLLDYLTGKAGFLDKLRAPTIGRSGAGGLINENDINQYGIASTTGPRANALRALNSITATDALSVLGIGASALIGRKPAQDTARQQAYTEAFDNLLQEFDGNVVAAQNEAVRVAKNQKGGFVRSVGAGMTRVTVGMTDAIGDVLLGGQAISERIGNRVRQPFTDRLPVRAARSNLGLNIDAYAPSLGPSRIGAQGSFSDLQARRGITLTEEQRARYAGFQTAGGVAGGIAGALTGATLGALTAEKLDVGPIIAAGMTITGGIIGNTVGTTLGQTIGAGFTNWVIAKGGLGAIVAGSAGLAAGVGGAAVLGTAAVIGSSEYRSAADGGLRVIEAREKARNAQLKQLKDAENAGRLQYTGIGTSGQFETLTPEQYRNTPGRTFSRVDTRTSFTNSTGGFAGLLSRAAGGFLPALLRTITPEILAGPLGVNRLGTGDLGSTVTSQFIDNRYAPSIRAGNVRPITGADAQAQINRVSATVGGQGIQELETNIKNITANINDLRATPDLEIINKAEIDAQTDRVKKLSGALDQLRSLTQDQDLLKEYGTTDENYINKIIQPARENFARSDLIRKQKEDKEIQDIVNQKANALDKLRNTAEGSFRLVGDVGSVLAGEDNPYTKVLADQITLGERMTRTWGHLGEAAVEYQKSLEGISINRQLNKLEYASFNQASNLRGQAARERDDRFLAPGLSRADQDYLDIQAAIVDKAVEVPKLWAQAAEVAGRFVNPVNELRGRIKNLAIEAGFGAGPSTTVQTSGIIQGRNVTPGQIGPGTFTATGPIAGGRIEGFSAGARQTIMPNGQVVTIDAGQQNDYAIYAQSQARLARLSPEARVAAGSQFADAALGIFSEYSPEQIRASGLQQTFGQALSLKAQGLDQRITDARRKAEYNAVQDESLAQQLREDDKFRINQLALGRDATDVGRESDRLLLSRTEGIPAKDLTYDVFAARQDALKREAGRAVSEQDDARQAVERGLGVQTSILENIAVIREAIIGGDLSMLLQVQNDTQARLDQEDLAEAHNGRYNVNLDQGATKSNPYSRINDRYGKGGIPKGKGGF